MGRAITADVPSLLALCLQSSVYVTLASAVYALLISVAPAAILTLLLLLLHWQSMPFFVKLQSLHAQQLCWSFPWHPTLLAREAFVACNENVSKQLESTACMLDWAPAQEVMTDLLIVCKLIKLWLII